METTPRDSSSNQSEEIKPPIEDAQHNQASSEKDELPRHDWRFWFTVGLLSLTGFITAVDNSIIFVSLPTIVDDLGSQHDSVWIANCYALAACSIQPLVGQICNIFGRKIPFYISVCIFAIGAGVSGGSSSAAMLIAGRTVQGLGAGAVMVFIDLIMCDITSQRERGKYLGLVMAAIGVGTSTGPLIGAALVKASWRWVFYIVLPFVGVILASYPLLRLKSRRIEGWKHALAQIDWFGNSLFTASITSICIGLIFGSYLYSWSSWHVLVPLILGVAGWISFHIFEATPLCKQPTVPPWVLSNRTALICYILTWIFGLLYQWFIYMLPVYFEAVKNYSPVHAAVDLLPFNLIVMPAGIVGGLLMSKTGRYRVLHSVGFAFSALGMGLLSILGQGSSTAEWVIWQLFVGIGLGFLFGIVLPPILASLPEKDVAPATALFSFFRAFGATFGITIPSVVFNSRINYELQQANNPAITSILGNGQAYGAASSGALDSLSSEDRTEADNIYCEALKIVWYVAMAFSLLGFVLVFGEKHYKLATEVNEDFNVDRRKKKEDGGEE